MARILTAVEHESTPRCHCWNSPRYPRMSNEPALIWGTETFLVDPVQSTDEMIRQIDTDSSGRSATRAWTSSSSVPARPRPPSDPPTSSTSTASAKTASHRSSHLPPRIVVGAVRIRSGVGVWYGAVVRCDAEGSRSANGRTSKTAASSAQIPVSRLSSTQGYRWDTRDPARLHDRRRRPRRHGCDGDERRPRGGEHPDRRHPRKGPAFPDNTGTRSTPRPNAPYPRRAVVSRT